MSLGLVDIACDGSLLGMKDDSVDNIWRWQN